MKKASEKRSCMTGLVVVSACFPLLLWYCGKTTDSSLRGEGFDEKLLRVMAVITVRGKEAQGEREMEKQLLAAGRHRARMLLNNHIQINCSDNKAIDEIRKTVPQIMESARCNDFNCDDHQCFGFVDFDISPLRNFLMKTGCSP